MTNPLREGEEQANEKRIESLKKSIGEKYRAKAWEYVKTLALSFFAEGNHDPVVLEQFLTACLSTSPKPSGVGSAIAGGLGRVNYVMGGGVFDFGKEISKVPGSIRDTSFLVKFFHGLRDNTALKKVYFPTLPNWFYEHRAEFDPAVSKEVAQYFSQKESPLADLEKAKILYGKLSDPDSQKILRGLEARISMANSTDAEGRLIEADARGRIASENAGKQGVTREQLEKQRDTLAAQYEKDVNNQDVVGKLAAVYEQLENWENAQELYEWAFSLTKGADKNWKNKANTMEEKLLLQKIKELRAAGDDNPDNATQIVALESELLQKQVEHAQSQVDQNPTDLKWHLALGRALFKSAQQKEDNKGILHTATIHTQRALKDPEKGNEARLLLAEIFSFQSLYDMALHHLDAIIDKEDGMTELRKEVLYSKGTILEKSGKTTEAKKCFEDIYAYDAGFRDVASKVLKEST